MERARRGTVGTTETESIFLQPHGTRTKMEIKSEANEEEREREREREKKSWRCGLNAGVRVHRIVCPPFGSASCRRSVHSSGCGARSAALVNRRFCSFEACESSGSIKVSAQPHTHTHTHIHTHTHSRRNKKKESRNRPS